MATVFDTLPGTRIPVYPESSIFETTIGMVVKPGTDTPMTIVTSDDIERILARPPWNFDEADLRLTNERIAALQKQVDEVAKKPPRKSPTKKAAAKKTPRKS